jgi:hypothetical protein
MRRVKSSRTPSSTEEEEELKYARGNYFESLIVIKCSRVINYLLTFTARGPQGLRAFSLHKMDAARYQPELAGDEINCSATERSRNFCT